MGSFRRVCAAAFGTALMAGTLHAATIDPPTVALSRGTIAIVVADFRGFSGDGRILFDNIARLQGFGEPPQLVEVSAPDRAGSLEAGARYVLAYSEFKTSKTRTIVGDPSGAHVLTTPGLEPAIWKAGAVTENLMLWRPDLEPGGIQGAVPRLLDMLASPDLDMQRFAAAEIRFRPALVGTLDAATQRRLIGFAGRERTTDPGARAAVLAVSHDMPDNARLQRQWDAVALGILRHGPLDTMAHHRHGELVATAFARIERRGMKVKTATLERWLRSDDNALNEFALLALRRQSPDSERAALAEALRRADLPADTRRFLEAHQRRLQYMRAQTPP